MSCALSLVFSFSFSFSHDKVRDLVEKVYGLAEVLVIPSVQLELCTKFGEPFITPKIFMDYFNQVSFPVSHEIWCTVWRCWQLSDSTRMRTMSACMRIVSICTYVRDGKLYERIVNLCA